MPNTHASSRIQMKEKWENLARQAPMYWIASGRTDWNTEEFYSGDAWYDGQTLHEFLGSLGIDLAGKRVLDLGCGMGRISLQFARYGAEVYGTDISEEMIRLARLNLVHVPRLHFRVGDGVSLESYPDGFFDVAWSYITFRHIPSLRVIEGYVREIGRVLAPGGRFILEAGNLRGWQAFVSENRAIRLGLASPGRLSRLGIRAIPTVGLVRYDAFAGVKVTRRKMLDALQAGGLVTDRTFSYNPTDHMFYAGHKA